VAVEVTLVAVLVAALNAVPEALLMAVPLAVVCTYILCKTRWDGDMSKDNISPPMALLLVKKWLSHFNWFS